MKNRILFYFSILQKKKGWWIRKPENEKRIALMTKKCIYFKFMGNSITVKQNTFYA